MSSQNNISSSWLNNVDITDLMLPGIYQILDIKNNRSYYGETDFMANRFVQHMNELKNETHSNAALLKAFKEQNKDFRGFRFIILHIGTEWKNKQKRLEKEQEYIKANADRCYNTKNEKPVFKKTIRPVMAKHKKYPSVHAAVRGEKIPRTTLIRYLLDPNNKDYFYILEEEQTNYGQVAIFGKKDDGPSVLFESYKVTRNVFPQVTQQILKTLAEKSKEKS
uniref:Putative GIY YIG homing endonuclease n=1 Tax=Oogamochlamys gigantea TaxID=158507 RepID=A0A0S2LMY8_9CHLO|nr:putative GIY YIG homing endonuclease [Oogamochlamys gigantea]ALO62837.1 putative GIY YIG homing endonuclease [Oogamochlamys gigantea]